MRPVAACSTLHATSPDGQSLRPPHPPKALTAGTSTSPPTAGPFTPNDSTSPPKTGWREDSESLNNTLDRTLYGGRITAHSAIRQYGVMIGFASGRNAIAHYIHCCDQKTTAA